MKFTAKKDDLLVRFWVPNGDLLGTGEMICPDGLDVAHPTVQKPMYLLTGEGEVRKISVGEYEYIFERSDAIPMLGSSFTDSAEKNIYAGDIVHAADLGNLIEVCFFKGMFALVLAQAGRPMYFPLLNVVGPPLTIVGDIYRNPELAIMFREGYYEV